MRVDGEVMEIKKNMQLDRYVIHDIEIVIDKLIVSEGETPRLSNSVDIAIKSGTKHYTLLMRTIIQSFIPRV